MKTPFISTPYRGNDFDLFSGIVNQGIDSRLEAFTRSRFEQVGHRFNFYFHPDEIPLLLRRLEEMGTEEADMWAVDIVRAKYGVELDC